MSIAVRVLGRDEAEVLTRVAVGVFDEPLEACWTTAFFADPRHHLAVAIEDGVVVGMVSAVDYVHPDKAPQLWINEIGVAPTHQRQGIGRQLLDAILTHGRTLGCYEAWLGTEETNVPAQALYKSVGGMPEQFTLYSFVLEPLDGLNDHVS